MFLASSDVFLLIRRVYPKLNILCEIIEAVVTFKFLSQWQHVQYYGIGYNTKGFIASLTFSKLKTTDPGSRESIMKMHYGKTQFPEQFNPDMFTLQSVIAAWSLILFWFCL